MQRKNTTSKSKNGVTLKIWQQETLAILALIILHMIMYGPSLFYGDLYPFGDTVEVLVNNHQIRSLQQQTGEAVMWNPYPWGGIPNLFYLPREVISVDYWLHLLAGGMGIPFVFTLFGALGMYVLLRYLRNNVPIAFAGAAIFALIPYHLSLIIVGHFDKMQALMYIPWLLWALKGFLDRMRWPWALALVLIVALQVRANHYQITFYTAFLALFVVGFHVARTWRQQQRSQMMRTLVGLVLAAVASLVLAAQPLWVAAKYAQASVRGGDVVNLGNQTDEQQSGGVSRVFVEQWSFTPLELMSLGMPHVVGGTSDESIRNARAYGLQQDVLPLYWGHSPFNTSYYYLGLIPLLLAFLSFLHQSERALVWALWGSSVLMLLWALGTFADPFYTICATIIPYFKNFRTPSTSLAMLGVIIPVLASLGLQVLQRQGAGPSFTFAIWRRTAWVAAGMVLGLLLLSTVLSFTKTGQSLDENVLAILRTLRTSLYYQDLLRMTVLLGLALGLLYLWLKSRIKTGSLFFMLLSLSIVDLTYQNLQYSAKPISVRAFEEQFLARSSSIRYLQSDADYFRVLPYSTDNLGLPYYVQTVGGGFELQMLRTAYEVFQNNLHHRLDGTFQVNWNILDMLNVKYVVSERELSHPNLVLEHTDPLGKYVYRYKFSRPRAWFVDSYQVIQDDVERLQRLNDENLDLRRAALLEEPVSEPVGNASQGIVRVVSLEPDEVIYTMESDAPGLLVLSEPYVPEMQRLIMDGEPVEKVYKANHMLQAVHVPAGLHTIKLQYRDNVYRISKWTSTLGFLLLYVAFEEQFLARSSSIRYLQSDADYFRVLPYSTDNLGLPYYVQTVGGGFELQMLRTAYEVFQNNLHHRLDGTFQVT